MAVAPERSQKPPTFTAASCFAGAAVAAPAAGEAPPPAGAWVAFVSLSSPPPHATAIAAG